MGWEDWPWGRSFWWPAVHEDQWMPGTLVIVEPVQLHWSYNIDSNLVRVGRLIQVYLWADEMNRSIPLCSRFLEFRGDGCILAKSAEVPLVVRQVSVINRRWISLVVMRLDIAGVLSRMEQAWTVPTIVALSGRDLDSHHLQATEGTRQYLAGPGVVTAFFYFFKGKEKGRTPRTVKGHEIFDTSNNTSRRKQDGMHCIFQNSCCSLSCTDCYHMTVIYRMNGSGCCASWSVID